MQIKRNRILNLQYYGKYDIIILDFAKANNNIIFQEDRTMNRPKATLKEKQKEKDCFVGGCNVALHDECAGIPKSNRCAACKCKKNYMKVEA